MIYLSTNTAGQPVVLTIGEARRYLPSFTNYLLEIKFMDRAGGSPVYRVVQVLSETERATTIEVDTTGIEISGHYSYRVLGQNSATNTDPSDASVVGECKAGTAYISAGIEYFNAPSITIPDNEYYQPE